MIAQCYALADEELTPMPGVQFPPDANQLLKRFGLRRTGQLRDLFPSAYVRGLLPVPNLNAASTNADVPSHALNELF